LKSETVLSEDVLRYNMQMHITCKQSHVLRYNILTHILLIYTRTIYQ